METTTKKKAYSAVVCVMLSYFLPSMTRASVGTAMPQILNDIGGFSMLLYSP
ncbi:hypothetical protein [Mesoaciditoga sp.]